MKISPNWRPIWVHWLVVAVAAAFVGLAVGWLEALTLCIGGLVSLITVVGTIFSTSQLFNQKPIALTSIAIVVKYALIGSILFYTVQFTNLSVLWLGLGIGLILPTLSISSLMSNQDNSLEDEDR